VDNQVPFNGGANNPNVAELYAAWADWNECGAVASEEDLDEGVIATSWTECQNNATVTIVTYDDLGHVFPEGGAALIWEFFEAHSRADMEEDAGDDAEDDSMEDEEELSGGVG
jgi:poly(3-hydroxybutyrate) depolymerase